MTVTWAVLAVCLCGPADHVQRSATPAGAERTNADLKAAPTVSILSVRPSTCSEESKGPERNVTFTVFGRETKTTLVTMERSAPLEKLMDWYCAEHSLERDKVAMFASGMEIHGTDTAADWELKDGDEVEFVSYP